MALNYDRGQYLKGYEDAREKYEKALDKICKFNDDNYVVFKEKYVGGHDCSEMLSAEQWKEWCMKDE